MNNLHDILEICLQDLENGGDLEKILARYPDLAEELRPILQASIHAKQMAVPAPSAEALRRNRAKLLQHAARLREVKPRTTSWLPPFQRLAIALVLLALFFVSGTSLVRASSSALPGDSLYSVKRSWEDLTVFFTFNTKARETLKVEYEQERLDEINQLFASGRQAKVAFVGIVSSQKGDGWQVANILVIVSEQTDIPDQPIHIGTAVRVIGSTNGDGIVLAERIELLPAGMPLPEVTDDGSGSETEQPQVTQELSGTEPATEAPAIKVTTTPSPTSTPKIETFEGTLNSINKDLWTVNNTLVNVANAEIKGVPVIGAHVKAEGYYKLDGVFITIKIEIVNTGSGTDNVNSNNNDGGNTNNNNGGGDDSGGNNNSNDDKGNGDNGGGGGGGNGNGNGG